MGPSLTGAHAGGGGARLHVLEVIGNAIVGGMESCVARLVERLPHEQFRVSALVPFESRFTARLRELDVEVLVAGMPDEMAWTSLQIACALVQSQGIDVLHAHMPNAHLLAGMAGRLTGRPVLATIHARQLGLPDLEVHRLAATHLAVVCRHTYFHALGLGVAQAQLSCIPNGVDTEVFAPRAGAGAWLRARFAVPEGAPLVGYVGRLSPEKCPDVFVRAAQLLHAMQPAAHCMLIGDGPMRENLMAAARDFGIAERVHFAGTCGDMPAAYNELDLLVSASHSEAMPLALLEGMASGLPIVATKVGGVPDLVEQGGTGWLVGARDHVGLAQQADEVLRQPGMRERMGTAARERALRCFSLAASAQQTAELLQRLAARTSPVTTMRPELVEPRSV